MVHLTAVSLHYNSPAVFLLGFLARCCLLESRFVTSAMLRASLAEVDSSLTRPLSWLNSFSPHASLSW